MPSVSTLLTLYIATGNDINSKAVGVVYSRGDVVWYRQRDGIDVPAKVRIACSAECTVVKQPTPGVGNIQLQVCCFAGGSC